MDDASLSASTGSSTASVTDYKATLQLPQTEFKMKANAAQREPEIEAFWDETNVYETAQNRADKSNRFLLHDGPPYLSSDKIHIGTALNKILKDIVTKYKTQQGFYSPYVPGYDGHGLPIENAVVKSIKGGRNAITPVELRKKCRDFAMANLKGQETNFKRLGVWGDWEHPYITIDGKFEAMQIRFFWSMYQKGYVYKGLKPVYWCPSCETALADAEVEYADHESNSIYVAFKAVGKPPEGLPEPVAAQWENTSFVIWTTTPWTLPANLAMALNADLTYVFVNVPEMGVLILAEALHESVLKTLGVESFEVLHRTEGRNLEHLAGQHPFYDRLSPTILGDHVTAEAGTGIVHTAPGHGHEDYLVGLKYDLDVLSPLNAKGVYTEEAQAPFTGVYYDKGNALVIDVLREKGALLHASRFSHSYPHCWRCHNPVIYRATEQWFISVDGFREKVLSEIKQVAWVPPRGENRITSMVENRSDWCISRQRVWGVPIPVFYCNNCNAQLINNDTITAISNRFETETSDCWWADSPEVLAGNGLKCESCSGPEFRKEMDIMDVWFDSGITHTAVVEARNEQLGHLPVELYLEGSDQHRGWFQSALLTCVAVNEKAPYKSVLTHGFVLDGNGRKMSKSLGNVVDPNDVMRLLGADVLRLWVASVDYTNDVRIGQEILNQLADIYRKVRNTLRFVLGNLHGFNIKTDRVAYEDLSRLDRYTLHRLQQVVQQLTDAFDTYEFHHYYQVLQNFCVTELSSLYFDVAKDILYTQPQRAVARRGIQTVLYELLATLTPMLVPVMPHMAEDIWMNIPDEHRPDFGQDTRLISILLAPWPKPNLAWLNDAEEEAFKQLLTLKDTANLALEKLRAEGTLKSSLEATLTITPHTPEVHALLSSVSKDELASLLIASEVLVTETRPADSTQDNSGEMKSENLTVVVALAQGEKCVRCWKLLPTVGQNAEHPQLCASCSTAVQEILATPATI